MWCIIKSSGLPLCGDTPGVLSIQLVGMHEVLEGVQASLKIPAFTHGCTQLSPQEIEKTRHLANVRIHIE